MLTRQIAKVSKTTLQRQLILATDAGWSGQSLITSLLVQGYLAKSHLRRFPLARIGTCVFEADARCQTLLLSLFLLA